MPKTPEEFLTDWVQLHIRAMPYQMHDEFLKFHIRTCEALAEREGITPRELKAAAGDNLKRYLKDKLEDAQDAVVKASRPSNSN